MDTKVEGENVDQFRIEVNSGQRNGLLESFAEIHWNCSSSDKDDDPLRICWRAPFEYLGPMKDGNWRMLLLLDQQIDQILDVWDNEGP